MNFEREGKLSNARAPRAPHAGRKFTKIYGNPRATAARALCIDFLVVIGTVIMWPSTAAVYTRPGETTLL